MEHSPEVLTKDESGGEELRSLVSRGSYVLCEYLNPETKEKADKKRKLSLVGRDGSRREYFVVPLEGDRSLLIHSEPDEKERKVWNPETEEEEDYWED